MGRIFETGCLGGTKRLKSKKVSVEIEITFEYHKDAFCWINNPGRGWSIYPLYSLLSSSLITIMLGTGILHRRKVGPTPDIQINCLSCLRLFPPVVHAFASEASHGSSCTTSPVVQFPAHGSKKPAIQRYE